MRRSPPRSTSWRKTPNVTRHGLSATSCQARYPSDTAQRMAHRFPDSAAELFLFWLYCHDQLTFHWFGDDLTAWPALVKDYEEVGSWERSKRDAWWAQYLMDRLRLLTDTSHPKIPASVISAWGLDAIHDAEAAVKEELGPTLRSRSPGSVACILRSGSEWEFDITKGWIPKHVKFDWFLSRVQEAIIRSYTTHQYAEFPEHEWLAPQSKDKKHLRGRSQALTDA